MKKVLTIAGGFSTEREVSIKTGRAVAKGIKNVFAYIYFSSCIIFTTSAFIWKR